MLNFEVCIKHFNNRQQNKLYILQYSTVPYNDYMYSVYCYRLGMLTLAKKWSSQTSQNDPHPKSKSRH